MAELDGQQLGQYQLESVIGQGGMASVYKAFQPSIQRFVAIKVIDGRLARDPDFMKRFTLEAQTIASLSHTHILKVFDFGIHKGQPYIVMELLRGGTLARLLQRGPIPPVKVVAVINQIASALDYAHSRGIIHRDLKPANLMLDDSGQLLLSDFGMAKLVNETSGLTQSGMTMGTPAYMAPEQWRGEKIDHRMDVYSLGVIIFEMLTGKTPFVGDTAYRMMYQHLLEAPPSLTSIKPDLPFEVEGVLVNALAKDAQARYSSAGALALAFRRAMQSPLSAEIVIPSQPPQSPTNPATIKLPAASFPTNGPAILKRLTTLAPGTVRTDAKGIAQVWVPPGCFQMGSNPDKVARPDEQPPHEVCLLHGYWLDQYPVTNGAFQEFLTEEGYKQRSSWSNAGWQWLNDNRITGPGNYSGFVDPQQPRVGVSWYEADAYARWRGGHLPTEAEWEYAARGPEARIYPWGNEFVVGKANVRGLVTSSLNPLGKPNPGGTGTLGGSGTTQVGHFLDSASWVGAYDMAGNVWEWTSDWYDEMIYREDRKNDPTGPTTGKTRSLRGGSWLQAAQFARVAARRHDAPIARDNYIGFRVLSLATK